MTTEFKQETPENLQEYLKQVVALLHKQAQLKESFQKQEQDIDSAELAALLHAHQTELQQHLDDLHPADIAHILEALPLADRLAVWHLVQADRDGDILLEVSDAVRETLIADMDDEELLAAAESLDTDELADLAPDLPEDVVADLMTTLDAQERERLQSALSYEDDQVGALMDFEMVSIRDDVTLEVVLRYLRRFEELPSHTDKLFVVDHVGILKGILPIKRLLLNDPDKTVADVMSDDPVTFAPEDDASDAAQAFERYDLVSAPVVDAEGKLCGRLTIDEMVDVIREESDSEALNRAGLREEEDMFATPLKSAKNRWLWVAVNLLTAFIASRVIGAFEGTISHIVELAGLATIISGICGNTGTQTTTLMIRGLALKQITVRNVGKIFAKEIIIAIMTGVLWGGITGFLAYLIYGKPALGLVMATAMLLNLVVAALVGMIIPITMQKLGRDPAFGSSVLLTFMTDSIGFFILLGLATVFLLH
ncbi:magnesium transporter [Leeia oryzae]|uniref:magnesium transporter n=1 Tax=Leeia oryzae TaxID=356662 RepID=UPI00037090EC|nr:magnesium transporter [Leeia oryzae]